jgi:hypothetical protein
LASYEEILERHMEKDGPLRVQYSYSMMKDIGKLMKPLDIYGKMQQGLKRKY